ncbi:MAG TPA: class I SAM-dependent methyltransferase [Armatimonadota bacterium]|jgi:ubiquinone/menaquinone biosynthesis C-methylase UbiE
MDTVYQPERVKARYAAHVEREWERLDATPRGKLMYAAHQQVLRKHITPGDAVLEVGAGPGRFTKELAELAGYLVVTDLTPEQLAANKARMTALGLAGRIAEWREADICDLSAFPNEHFDAVVCIGGPFNYVFEQEDKAFTELLRVLRPDGVLILGLMCLPGAARAAFKVVLDEFEALGLEAAKWLLETGKQDGSNYPITYNHRVHLMTRNDVLALCQAHGAKLIAEYCGGFLSAVSDELLERTYANPRLWQLLLEAELRWDSSPGLSEAGDHMLMVVGA